MKSSHSAHFSLLALCALFFLPFLSSCGDDPSDPGGGADIGIGSTFTLAWYNTDGQGNAVPFSHDTVVTTLAAIESYKGKDNVYRYDNRYGSGYNRYESNGDVLTYLPERIISGNGITYTMPALWVTLPAGTQQPVSTRIWDSTQTSGNVTAMETYTYNASHIGTSTVTVGTETFTAQVVEYSLDYRTLVVEGSDTLIDLVNSIKSRIEYVPELGLPVRESIGSQFTLDGDNRPLNGQRRELISYELK